MDLVNMELIREILSWGWVQWLSLYFMCGVLQTALIDWIHHSLIKYTQGENFSNGERTLLILLWPIYGIAFWYNFWKGWFNKEK